MKYTVERLESMSDPDINRLVAEKEGLGTDNGYGFVDTNGNVVCYDVISPFGGEACEVEVSKNYCGSWVDMGPIIEKKQNTG